jgi:hypothetical protein
MMSPDVARTEEITARYRETDEERLLEFERHAGGASASEGAAPSATAVVAQNREGYAMLKVRQTADGDEIERYYGFDVALDHAAELLGVSVADLPVPESAEDMGM